MMDGVDDGAERERDGTSDIRPSRHACLSPVLLDLRPHDRRALSPFLPPSLFSSYLYIPSHPIHTYPYPLLTPQKHRTTRILTYPTLSPPCYSIPPPIGVMHSLIVPRTVRSSAF